VRLLVTGGAGFMGSNYVHHTAATNPEARILVYDKLTYAGRPENLQGLDPSRVKLLAADILDYDRLVEVLRSFQPDYVVNFAAETHVDRSIRDPSVFVEVNVRGLHTLLEALRRVDNSTLIHISTDEVYGDITGEPVAEDAPSGPATPTAPARPLGTCSARPTGGPTGSQSA